MKLYHSTNVSFDEIDLTKSKPNKDFGKAFYVSAKGITFQYAFCTQKAIDALKKI